MAGSRARTITDHEEIRHWAEERGARPACVRGTGSAGDVGMVRLDFPGYSGEESLEHISWDDWFDKFDGSHLALIIQDTTARGEKSNFNKLVSRSEARAEGRQARGRGRARSSARVRSSASRRVRTGRARRKSSRSSKSRSASAQSRRGKRSASAKRRSSRSRSSRKGGSRGKQKITLTIPKDVRIEPKGRRRGGRRAA